MSWWTSFRDSALVGAGLKKGGNAAKTIAAVARPTFQSATNTVHPAQVSQPDTFRKPSNNSNKYIEYLKNNPLIGVTIVLGGGLLILKNKLR